jgi:hypothetical protein
LSLMSSSSWPMVSETVRPPCKDSAINGNAA